MNTVAPKPPRWKRIGNEYVIPSLKRLLVIVGLSLFSGMWLWSGVRTIGKAIARGGSAEQIQAIWIFGAAWGLGLLGALLGLMWHLVGSEVLAVEGRELVLKWKFPPFTRSKRYDVASIRDLRALQVPPWGFRFGNRPQFGNAACALAFDYGARTVRFGVSLDEAEAKLLVKELGQRYPDLVRPV